MKDAKEYTKKTAKELNIWTRLYQLYAIFVLFRPFVSLFYKYKISGQKNFDRKKPHIFAANHISYLDPFLLATSCFVKISFMAKIELFQNSSYVARNIARLGGFAVNRAKLDLSTIKSVKEVAKAKWSLGIFPQGGIRKNKKIEKINKGFAVMAKMMQYDIVPMSITGCESYNWNIFKKPLLEVKMGTPISWELDEEEIIKQWREQVAQMSGYELVCEKEKEEVSV